MTEGFTCARCGRTEDELPPDWEVVDNDRRVVICHPCPGAVLDEAALARDLLDERVPASGWGSAEQWTGEPQPPLPDGDEPDEYDPLLDTESPPCPPGCRCPEHDD